MTSLYKTLTEKIVNNSQTKFMLLNEIQMEQKKYVSKLTFKESEQTTDNDVSRDDNNNDNTLTLQLPACQTKNGIVEQASKTYTDLLFNSDDEGVKELVDLLIAMEEESAKQLHTRSGEWFEGDTDAMSLQSFEDMFTPVVRYVNRQQNVCVRVHLITPISTKGIKQQTYNSNAIYDCDVYDKSGKMRPLSDIRSDTQILPLVEVKEIRMTSTSVSLHLNLVECMIVKDSPTLISSDEPQTIPTRRIQPSLSNLNIERPEEKETYDKTVESVQVELEKSQEVNENENENKNENENENENENKSLKEEIESNDNQVEDVKETVEDDDGNIDDDGLSLLEVDTLDIDEADTIQLRKPDDVYRDIYKAAISKAKKLRQVALEAYLDAKKIKAKFMLDDVYDSDDAEDDAEVEEVTNISFSS